MVGSQAIAQVICASGRVAGVYRRAAGEQRMGGRRTAVILQRRQAEREERIGKTSAAVGRATMLLGEERLAVRDLYGHVRGAGGGSPGDVW